MAMVQDNEVLARLKQLVDERGCRPVARLVRVARQTLDAALRGEPLRRSTWEKISSGLDAYLQSRLQAALAPHVIGRGGCLRVGKVTGVSRHTIAKILAGVTVTRAKLLRVAAAMPALEASAKSEAERVVPTCRTCARPSDRDECWRCATRTSKSCVRCGHRHASDLNSAFCCLIVPPTRGHCGWCGADCQRAYCSKPCSVAYHADVTNGTLGDGMVSGEEVAYSF